tara:strand:+ start:219 stop:437 length:219 start_codon:yes stop_codon:yes gene_type:complete
MENKEILLIVLGLREDKKIIIKNAKKENTKCLLKKIYDSFKEKDKIIPIPKSTEINIKLILSISFHHIFELK